MQRALSSAIVFVTAGLLLAACAAEPSTGSPTPTTNDEQTSSSPTSNPAAEQHLVISVDGIAYTEDADTVSAAYDDAAALLELLKDATGEMPTPVDMEDPPGYEMNFVTYDWDGLRVITEAGGIGTARVSVTSADVDGIQVATEEGLTVGSSRADLVDAQGWDQWDQDGDGVADYIGLGHLEVPGTVSLTHPGTVGSVFLLFALENDTVTQIQAPSDDFSDL